MVIKHDKTHILEMPDGARLLLSARGWVSDSRPALASILNQFYPADSDLDKLADYMARRFRWQLLKPPGTPLNGLIGGFGTVLATMDGETRLAPEF